MVTSIDQTKNHRMIIMIKIKLLKEQIKQATRSKACWNKALRSQRTQANK